MARLASLSLALAAALAACKPAPPTLDPEAEPFARALFAEVRDGANLDDDAHLAHELKNATTEEEIGEFRGLIPLEPARTIELTSWDAKSDSTGVTTRLTQTYRYADRTLIVQTALFKSPAGKDPVNVGFRVSESPVE